MSTFDYGNYGNLGEKSNAAELAKLRKEAAETQLAKSAGKDITINFPNTPQIKTAEASANDVLALYNTALTGLGKVNVAGLGLTPEAQATVSRYVTPEQQASISGDFMAFMAIA
jgi:hypothetical protein